METGSGNNSVHPSVKHLQTLWLGGWEVGIAYPTRSWTLIPANGHTLRC